MSNKTNVSNEVKGENLIINEGNVGVQNTTHVTLGSKIKGFVKDHKVALIGGAAVLAVVAGVAVAKKRKANSELNGEVELQLGEDDKYYENIVNEA